MSYSLPQDYIPLSQLPAPKTFPRNPSATQARGSGGHLHSTPFLSIPISPSIPHPCTRLPVEASISCLPTFLRAFRHTLISSYLWSLANSPSKPHMFLIVCFQYLKSHSSRNLQWPCRAVPQKDSLPDQSQPPQLLRTGVRNRIHKTQNRANARYQHLKLQPSQVKVHTHQCKYIINNIYNNMDSLVQSNCYSIGLSNAI